MEQIDIKDQELQTDVGSAVNRGAALPLTDSKIEAPKDFDELMILIHDWSSEEHCVWRGQSNYLWSPIPSLYRRLRRGGLSDEQINEAIVAMEEQNMVNVAMRSGLYQDTPQERLRLMADLQHYGGATRFLDVTYEPLVGLFFACWKGNDSLAGCLRRYRINPDCILHQDKGATWDDVLQGNDPGRPTLIEPVPSNVRMKTRHAAFLTTVLDKNLEQTKLFSYETFDAHVDMILIVPQLKERVLDFLRGTKFNEKSLFPPTIQSLAEQFSVDKTPWYLQ